MKFFSIFIYLAVLFFLGAPPFVKAASITCTIIRVIDGDSLLVNNGGIEENVRLIGIDAPEAGESPKAERDAVKSRQTLSNVLKKGRESAKYLKKITHRGEQITVETDVEQRDPYGRLLGYVYLSGGMLLNEEMVRAGFAAPLVIEPNVKYRKKIQSAYESALKNKRGLWGKSKLPVPAPEKSPAEIRRAWKKSGGTIQPGPQTEVTDQTEVTGQKEVSGKPTHN